MAKNVGTMASMLTANATNFNNTLDAAEQKLQRFHDFAERLNKKNAAAAEKSEFTTKLTPTIVPTGFEKFKSMLEPHKAITDHLAGVASSAAPGLSGFVSQLSEMGAAAGPAGIAVVAATASVAGLGAVAVGVGMELRSIWEEMAPGIVHMGNLAKETGSSTESLIGFHLAAQEVGVSGEGIDSAMQHLQRTLGQAKQGGGEATAAFHALGISTKNIASLADGSGDAALRKIMESLHDLHNPALEAAEGQKIFGRQFREIAPLVEAGGAALDKATAAVMRHGSSYSALDAAKVQEASAAVADLEDAWVGVKTQITIGMAPYVKVLAEDFEKMAVKAIDFGKTFLDAIGDVDPVMAQIADDFETLWDVVEPGVFILGALVVDMVQMAKILSEVAAIDLMPLRLLLGMPAPTWGDRLVNGIHGGKDSSSGPEDEYERTRRLDKKIEEIQRKHADISKPHKAGGVADSQVATELIDKFNEQAKTFGMTARAAEIYKASLSGLSDVTRRILEEQDRDMTSLERVGAKTELTTSIFEAHRMKLEELRKLQGPDWTRNAEFKGAKIAEDENFRKKVEGLGDSLFKATRNPLEMYQDKMKDLDALKAGGLDMDTYNRAAGQDAMDLLKTDQSKNIEAPKALEAGSGEAYSAILKATRPEQSVQERIAKILAQLEVHAGLQLQVARETQRALSKPGPTFKIGAV